MTPTGLDVILLAAGSASRFGSAKLLLDVGGRPMLDRALETLLEVALRERIVVVLGAHADLLEPRVRPYGVRVVVNPEHASGIASSLRTGISQLKSDCRGVLVALADQVAVNSDDLERLISTWEDAPDRIAAARYDSVIGVPAIFPAAMRAELANLQGDRGARDLLRHHATQVVSVPMPSAAVDVDTPEDLQRVNTSGV